MNNNVLPLYKRRWFMWVMLFLFPPVGIALMWLYSGYKKVPKVILSLFFGLIFIAALGDNKSTNNTASNIASNTNAADTKEDKEVEETSQEDIQQEEEKVIKTGWQSEDNKYYYYDQNGVKKTGWVEDSGKYYYCSKTGEMQTGWIEENNKNYYCNSDGIMQTGWVKDNNIWYHLDSNGVMETNTTLEGYNIGADGAAVKEAPKMVESNTSGSSGNSGSSIGSGSTSSGSSTTTYEPAQGDRTVYWVPNGKSYHYSENCSTLKRSKTILSGKASECPKTDPCDKCAH